MSEEAKLHADESVKGEGGSNVTVIRLPGLDRPMVTSMVIMGFLSAVAIAMSAIAIYRADDAAALGQKNEREGVYFTQRAEGFLETLANNPVLNAAGIKVPCDLLPHRKDCK